MEVDQFRIGVPLAAKPSLLLDGHQDLLWCFRPSMNGRHIPQEASGGREGRGVSRERGQKAREEPAGRPESQEELQVIV